MGLSWPLTFPFFIRLIPYALILNILALYVFHPNKIGIKSALVFSLIFILGYVVELIGVNTGLIFGRYHYGNGLGFQLFHTPLIIGLNWLLLVYTASAILFNQRMHPFVKIALSSFLMLGYDIVLEQVAPSMDMWHWGNGFVPLQNYLAWFVISLLLNTLIQIFGVSSPNRLAWVVLVCQFLFFSCLSFILI
jgi:putative membrane protein